MDLTAQIPDVTVGRAANAPDYEYMTTFGKRTAELPVDHGRGRKTHPASMRGWFSAGKCAHERGETDRMKQQIEVKQ
jgi:hypothetical protein